MKTVILKSYENLRGVVEYYSRNDELVLEWNIESHVPKAKLLLMSSSKPFNPPVFAGNIELGFQDSQGRIIVNAENLIINEYNPDDIDTFVFVRDGAQSEEVMAVGYASLIWDVRKSIKIAFEEKRDMSLVRGELLLKKMKKPPEPMEVYRSILQKAENLRKKLSPALAVPCPGYDWFSLTRLKSPLEISSYEHLLMPDTVRYSFDKEGEILYGIGNRGKTAFALKGQGFNPFVTAEDCVVKSGEYYIVGVHFAPDGQYFEKIPPTE